MPVRSWTLHLRLGGHTLFLQGNRFLFTGREYMPETGLYDYRNRFYHPGLAASCNPIRSASKAIRSTYRYCGNDFVNRSDPNGLIDSTWATATGGFLSKIRELLDIRAGQAAAPSSVPFSGKVTGWAESGNFKDTNVANHVEPDGSLSAKKAVLLSPWSGQRQMTIAR